MGQPAAKKGDTVIGTCTHTVLVPTPSGAFKPQALPHPFTGIIDNGVSADVKIMGQPAAVVGAKASNTPKHIPTPPGTKFQSEPSNQATLNAGSSSIRVNGKALVRNGDSAETCDEMKAAGTVIAVSTVNVG